METLAAWFLPIVVVVATVFAMEILARWTHEHVMHGWMWHWHKSHHEPQHGPFEKNDLFAVLFTAFAIALFVVGAQWAAPLLWIAIGISIYGALYFLLHDGLVHQRWPFRYIPRKGYLKRVYQAHRLHHATQGRDGAVSFGFVYAEPIDRLVKKLDENRRGPIREESGTTSAR